jgi:hypothetical protein
VANELESYGLILVEFSFIYRGPSRRMARWLS